jgi:hypothetical protein
MRKATLIGLGALVLAVAAISAGCGGNGSGKDGVPSGHGVHKTVSFTDHYGATTIGIESAGTSETIFKDLYGKPIESDNGTFVFVTFSKFDSPVLTAGDLLEVKGSNNLLYGSRLTNGPDSGGARSGYEDVDPNHFTEAFDLPKDAARGAVLIIHEGGTDRESLGSGAARPIPPDYADGAHEVDLGL